MEQRKEPKEFYDVVVIGSGFGGSVTALRAAEAGRSVLVLERGKEYRPGTFARSPMDMATNLWDPSEGLYGLFQFWSFRALDAIVASGLGGGSLVYANVLLPMPEDWFDTATWPLTYADVSRQYDTVARMMGATEFPIKDLPPEQAYKANAFRAAVEDAELEYRPARLAIRFAERGHAPGEAFGSPDENRYGVQRYTCRLHGQCDLGCNEGAKNTLDLTYLTQAERAATPAEIFPLHEARQISERPDGGYEVGYLRHDPPTPAWERTRRPPGDRPAYRRVRAKVVVLAAGTMGTSWLLLANRAGLPRLSDRLGTRFSGNGDMLGFLTGSRSVLMDSPRSPVITGVSRTKPGAGAPAHFVQDGGYPEFLGWIGETLRPALAARATGVLAARLWARARGRPAPELSATIARLIGSAQVSRSTLPLLAMGMDAPTGTMRLTGGHLDIDYRASDSASYFEAALATMRELARVTDSRFLENPSARLSRNVTVHPLGGAPMGHDRRSGVVGPWGEVFGHDGLFVADGSVMPGPVGANPSMTIAALAERFSERIVEKSAP
jgi:cholesterol oxidase